MTKKVIHSLEHKLLIAMPQVKDELFAKSVMYVYEHDDQGAMAFIINKPLPISMGDILRQLNMELPSQRANELFLLQGGPVSKEQLYVVQCLDINNPTNVTLVQPQDFLQAFAKGEELDNILAFLGYAGWGRGQLESELTGNDWIICPEVAGIFQISPEKRWEYCMSLIGINPAYVSSNTGHA